ncbi:peptidase inhibitor family I36 protein [Kribbella sp. NBC_01505]|uniref:peptidase inhibitor family I36 protein n=1 Tax=Kribbella sp. NBC_01505 TaxID=2903580 RepID=UPI00386F2681
MRVFPIAAASLIALTGLTMASHATASLDECDNNNMCMWDNNNFGRLIGERGHGSSTITNLGPSGDNKMDSWANRSAVYGGCMYTNANGGGDKQTMNATSSDDNVSPLNSDEVSSWRTRYGCG